MSPGRALVEAQAKALGVPLVTSNARWQDYEGTFRAALRDARDSMGITDVVFGDIDLAPHRAWEETQCAAVGLRAHLPLWQVPRDAAVQEFLSLGYRARVTCVDACGENGEFHTFVFDGPRFRAPVEHRVARIHRHDARHPLGDATYYIAQLEAP